MVEFLCFCDIRAWRFKRQQHSDGSALQRPKPRTYTATITIIAGTCERERILCSQHNIANAILCKSICTALEVVGKGIGWRRMFVQL